MWSHWVWFAFPHGTVAYVLLKHRDQFPSAAARIYATFDIGVIGYWAIPTAPPWYAAQQGLMEDGRTPELRRMMVEYGEQFWKQGWAPLYGVLGGNPLAAMPSLHFATSVTAAHVLSDTGPVAGALGWTYAATLGPRARLPRRALRRRSGRRARRWPRASGAATPTVTPAAPRLCQDAAGSSRPRRGHDAARRSRRSTSRRPATSTRTTIAASSSPAAAS